MRAPTWNRGGVVKQKANEMKNYGDRGENLRQRGWLLSNRVRDSDHQGFGIPLILPRTEKSLSWWKFARKGRREIESGFSPSHGPFHFLASHLCFTLCSFNASDKQIPPPCLLLENCKFVKFCLHKWIPREVEVNRTLMYWRSAQTVHARNFVHKRSFVVKFLVKTSCTGRRWRNTKDLFVFC